MITISALGAVVGLGVAIILIIKKINSAYSLILGSIIGGLVGGANISETVSLMITGAQGMIPAILRIITAGVLAGVLIETGAASKIAETIIEKLGESKAIIAIVLSTMILTMVGVFIDVSVITVAPIAMAIAKRTNLSRTGVLIAMVGGGKAGNIMSPNPNAIAAADAFNIPLTSVMIAGIIPAIFGIIVSVIIAKALSKKGSQISDDDLENANEIFEIKREITKLNRKITAYKTRLNRLSNNVSETVISDAMDLDELKAFFPNMNFRRIEEIQDFHRKISRLVNPRIEEEISIIENMIFRAEESVKELENRCRQKGATVNFSTKFLNDFSEVEKQIAITKTQNSNYNKVKSIRDEAKNASKNLKELEIGILRDIADKINERISYLNGLIDSATEKAPVLTVKNNTSYSFSSDDDKGMGTSYKNLILFDLSIFQLTWLPVLIHDSMIFNNLSEKRLNGIFQLLGKSEKQLFVAFDHFDGLAHETLGIIDNAAIIELDLDGKQLFGSAWNTIQSL